MELSPAKTRKKVDLPARFNTFKLMWQELLQDPQAFRILVACTLAMISTAMEPAFLTLSTPEVQNRLRNPESHAPLFVAFYVLLLAIVTLVAGTSGDLFGRKLVMVGGLVWLTLANILGVFTLGTPQFIIVDIICAIATAAVIPMCVAVVALAFPPVRRPLAFGVLFGLNSVAIIVGGALGGLFDMWGIPNASFIPVVIVGVFAILYVIRNVPESRAQKGLRRTSAFINLLLLVSIFFLVFLALSAPALLTTWLPVIVAGCVVLLIGVSVRWLSQRVRFFQGVELFTGRDTGFSMVAGVVIFLGHGALFYQLTAFFQKIQGMSAVLAGAAFAPYVIGILLGTAMIPVLAGRFGARRVIVIGLVLMSVGQVLFSFIQVETSYWILLVPMLIVGTGFGIGNPARTQVVLGAPPRDLTGSSAAVNSAVGQSGYGLGVVLSSLFITLSAQSIFMAPLATLGLSAAKLQQIESALPSIFNQTSSGEYPGLPQAVLDLVSGRYDQAFTASMGRMFLTLAILLFVTAVIIYIGMHRNISAIDPALRKARQAMGEDQDKIG